MALRADERVHAEQRLYAVQVSRLRHAVGQGGWCRGLPVGPRNQDQVLDVRVGCLSDFLSCLKMANRWLVPVQKPSVPENCSAFTYGRA